MPQQAIPPGYSVGAVARRFNVPPWKVRRAIERGFLDEPARIGPYRVFISEDLPRVEVALRQAGYLPAEVAPA